MKFRDILENADNLYPNSLSEREKMNFANDIGAAICRKYLKNIKSHKAMGGEGFSLPHGVKPDMVTEILFDGESRCGVSVSAVLNESAGHEVEVKYIDVPTYSIDDEVPLSSPHHNIYLYYILSFICLHSGDQEGYNDNFTLYNSYLREYEKSLSGFGGKTIRYKNLW